MGSEALPKLTKPQLARLVEIGASEGGPACLAERQPRTIGALVIAGALERYQWRGIKWVRLTLLGTRILAGLPGDEFDRFRAALTHLATEPAPQPVTMEEKTDG